MDFSRSNEQKMLADTVRSFGEKTSPLTRMRRLRDDALGFEPTVWAQMAELGWLAIPFPESAGGLGGSFEDAALIAEELARTLVPEPYVSSGVLGGYALLWAGTEADQSRWLAPMIEGKTTLALAFDEAGMRADVARTQTRAVGSGAEAKLTGEKVWVLGGHAADQLIVSAVNDAGLGLYVVDGKGAGVERRTARTIDGRHAAMISLNGAAGHALAAADGGRTLKRLLELGAAMACVEGASIAARMLEMTVEYLRTREQFGVKIGSFQALQHRAVDMFVEVELCKSAALFATAAAQSTDDEQRASIISAAKAQLAAGGRFVAEQAIQLHGGIGVTDEHDIGLFYKRMVALNLLFGDREHHLTRYAAQPSFSQGAGPLA
jgi:alkylation response protein AidB-like acyl-CoA dehydrogenase